MKKSMSASFRPGNSVKQASNARRMKSEVILGPTFRVGFPLSERPYGILLLIDTFSAGLKAY